LMNVRDRWVAWLGQGGLTGYRASCGSELPERCPNRADWKQS
jgi:hypothetical protein